ncbi:hypothetical protein BN2364_3000 [Alloalcanivorax xenomutans]|nr:hypothetical protein BN2364_3000 [Alloalcanivorax xenomutans]
MRVHLVSPFLYWCYISNRSLCFAMRNSLSIKRNALNMRGGYDGVNL